MLETLLTTPQFIHYSPLLLREAGERFSHSSSHLPLSRSESSYCSSSSIDIEETSRSRGVISPESPEPGYIVVSFTLLVLNPIPAPSTFSPSRLPLSFAIPMASAVTYRRQLAPTVGQTEALTGVKIRTGFSSASGGSHASGLILRRGAIDYVVDYSERFGVGAPLPPGVSLQVGSHRLFIGSFPEAYPREIRVFSCITDPLSTRCCIAAPGGEDGRVHAAVMMAGASSSSNRGAASAARRAKEAADATERVSTSALRDVLYTPVNRNGDPDQVHIELETARLALARRLGAITREYNAAHANQRRPIAPTVLEDLRSRGRAVGRELSGAEQPATSAFVQRPASADPPNA